LENRDRPGIVGQVGTLLGEHQINIAAMSLGRDQIGGEALTILNLDSRPTDSLLQALREDPDIVSAKVIEL
jgi:D-3-phosphoglycerate dehydrogenase